MFQKELYREEDGQSVCEVHHDSIREALGEDNAGISGRAHAAVLFYLQRSRSQRQTEQAYIVEFYRRVIMYGVLSIGHDCYAVQG